MISGVVEMWKKVLGIGVVILALLMAGCIGTGTGQGGATSEKVIKVGALVDFSGPLSTHGIDTKNNLELAKEDIERLFLVSIPWVDRGPEKSKRAPTFITFSDVVPPCPVPVLIHPAIKRASINTPTPSTFFHI